MMFCHKCGAQIAEEADFCHQCGTKVIHTNNALAVSPLSPTVAETEVNLNTRFPIQTALPEADGDGFKAFVDNHIQNVTDFQSAEELLSSKVSLRSLWICLGISAVLGIITLNPILLLFFLLLGYAAARGICGVKKGRCAFRYQGKMKDESNIDDLIRFMNTHLSYLQPYFHEWGDTSSGRLSAYAEPYRRRQRMPSRRARKRSGSAHPSEGSSGVWPFSSSEPTLQTVIPEKRNISRMRETGLKGPLSYRTIWGFRSINAS